MINGLIADIGGTNARFALVDGGTVHDELVLKCADHASFAAGVRAYVDMKAGGKMPRHASISIAAAVGSDRIALVNNENWSFSINETKRTLGFDYFSVMNDFKAIALSVPHLPANEVRKVGRGEAVARAPIGVIGPGTGLGAASLVWDGNHYLAVPGEGGHMSMPAKTQREFDIFNVYLKKYTHVSAERVCSGKGLVNLYNAIIEVDGLDLSELPAEEISRKGAAGDCKACAESLDLMMGFLGTAAGNLALTVGAFGGVYIAGGVVPKLGSWFDSSRFRHEFEAKGRLKDYMTGIPTFVILNELCALTGLRADLMAA